MRAIFLDRDGVLNELVYYPDFAEDESPRTAPDLRPLPGVWAACQRLAGAGWALFIVSNQPSYAKGKTTLTDLKAVHRALVKQAGANGVTFTAAYYSYTHPRGVVPGYTTESLYRKPNPGFLLEAARDHAVDLRASWFVGDRDTDIQCGAALGLSTAQVRYPLSAGKQGNTTPTVTAADLTDFTDQLLTTS